MKTKLLNALIVLSLLIVQNLSYSQGSTLGTAANFVLFSSFGAVTNTGITHLTGNVGTNSGSSKQQPNRIVWCSWKTSKNAAVTGKSTTLETNNLSSGFNLYKIISNVKTIQTGKLLAK